MEEDNLTDKQRAWLEASRRIGPGPMTKSERQTLERLYADMLPVEQQQLARYIQDKFGRRQDEEKDEQVRDPVERMMERTWPEPSQKLRESLGKTQIIKPPALGDNS